VDVVGEEAFVGELEEHAVDFHEIGVGLFDWFEFFVAEFFLYAFFAVLCFEDLADVFFNLLGHE
jgi:hypothetical protein